MGEKEKCDCGKMAVWVYMPGYSGGGNPYSCEDCVNRGCACNWRWIKEPDGHSDPYFIHEDMPEGIEGKDWMWIVETDDRPDTKGIKAGQAWTKLDEKGREEPCGEYDFSKDGWDKEPEE